MNALRYNASQISDIIMSTAVQFKIIELFAAIFFVFLLFCLDDVGIRLDIQMHRRRLSALLRRNTQPSNHSYLLQRTHQPEKSSHLLLDR